MVTIKDVARVSGLSTSTISRVIRGESNVKKSSRAKILKVIEELGYKPNVNAQALVSKRTNSLGVVIPRVSFPFFGALACGAEQAAKEKNYKMLIINAYGSAENELEAIDSLVQHRCGAIVFHSMHLSDDQLVELAEKIPGLVFINRFINKLAHRCVWLDNNHGAQETAKYLIERGHKDIAVVSREDVNPDAHVRLEGVRTALLNAGLSLPDNMIARGTTGDMDSGREAAAKLLASGQKFTAVLPYNDNMALGVVHELVANGKRIPDDVSVIGFDDLLISRACIPELTTMHYPIEEMANYAANLAMEISEEPINSGRTHLFMANMVERDSVADIG